MFDPAHVLEAKDIQIREDLTVEVPPIALEESRVEEGENRSVLSKSYGIGGPVTLLGVGGGYEEITSTSVYMISFHFRGQKFLLLGRM